MSITAFDGAIIGGYPEAPYPGQPSNTNPTKGPSLFKEATGILDPRLPYTYIPGQDIPKRVFGLLNLDYWAVDQVPVQNQTASIAAAQTATAGTAMTLVTSNTTGVTVSSTIINGSTGATVTGLLALDTAMTGVQFGTSGSINIWDPTKAVARNIVINCNGNDTSGSYTVVGFDLYGVKMSETITGANGTAAGASGA